MLLIRVNDNFWQVNPSLELASVDFTNVDDACDYMVDKLGADDEEVDDAVIAMHVNQHSVAVFYNGVFDHSIPE